MSQKSVYEQQNQILKVFRCRKKLSTETKSNFKSRPRSQEIVHGQQNQIFKSRSMSQEIAHG